MPGQPPTPPGDRPPPEVLPELVAWCNFWRGSSLSSVLSFQLPARFLVRGRSAVWEAVLVGCEATGPSCGCDPGSGPGGACALTLPQAYRANSKQATAPLQRVFLIFVVTTCDPCSQFPRGSGKVPAPLILRCV